MAFGESSGSLAPVAGTRHKLVAQSFNRAESQLLRVGQRAFNLVPDPLRAQLCTTDRLRFG